MSGSEDPLVLNGIDGVTGQYLVQPVELPAAAEVAEPSGHAPYFDAWKKWLELIPRGLAYALPFDVDSQDPTQAGWGVVFHAQASDELRKGLEPLIAHRRELVEADRMHVLAYQPGETAHQFLARHGVGVGDVDPTRVPFYLLLVGGPEDIPYDLQHALSLSYAVGRLSFDTPAEYARYAESVVTYETGATVPNHRQVSWWAPKHLGDRSTHLSADDLVTALARGASADLPPQLTKTIAAKLRYASRDAIEDDATKEWLLSALHGRDVRPAVLFTASHGVGFPSNDARQRSDQGALLSQDWTGFGAMAPAHYVAASDIQDDARLHGLVAFFFACFGVGTPAHDEFPINPARKGEALAPAAFVAALPRRLLSHPAGGALAVIGHVERAWGFSIKPLHLAQSTLHPFRNTLAKIMSGQPVGHALRDFRDRFSDVNNILLTHLDANTSNGKLAPRDLIHRWIERNDARNYVVLGDPAVRIRHTELQAIP
ncbi:C25 family cysteine peptidase [Corallococcus sp. bb12-1]|uniref:C25 family cysteine peptidase n=1 Tax=Corallococcus sp. bb12-1 TaxID=2996784 RepID=UPI00226FE472|nr:C25 family cysteine peptidase [Corallococcus sp. bb12-1]MCY1047391.1 C25 family cysteine peptidase [Corallococcus sp. bb12-1]